MINITKNGKVMTVARSAYEGIFKPNGWTVLNHEKESKNVETKNVEEDIEEITDDEWADAEEEAADMEGVSKPLSEMNKRELEELAFNLGIDISKVNSNKQLRELIRSRQ